MLNPSKSGWIKKYISLFEKREIELSHGLENSTYDDRLMQSKLAESGIIFGIFAEFLFIKNQGEEKWTNHEKLMILYFESMLLVYRNRHEQNFKSEHFVQQLELFLNISGSREIDKIWSINRWIKIPDNIEKTIAERTRIPLNFNDNIWVSYLQNSLCYLDIVLFDSFIQNPESSGFVELRKRMVKLTLCTIILAFQADAFLDESERKMFGLFLASADLSQEERSEFEELLISGVPMNSIEDARDMSSLFRKYLFELAIFSMLSDTEFSSRERKVLNQMANLLTISEEDISESYHIVEAFTVKHEEIVTQLKSDSSYEKIFDRLSSKWSKLLLRNKDKLVKELKESNELVSLVKKSMSEPLNDEEKAKVKTQFMDIAKSVPSLAIFLLPGGAFLLPFVLKILPDLIPSAFRDNDV